MKNKEKIKAEPLLEINVKVDRTINGEYDTRLNWSSFNLIDVIDIFMTPTKEEYPDQARFKAQKKAKDFKARLKAYIIEKADKSELKNFDWSEWDMV